MADISTLDNIDIFDNRDILDRSVEAYEENVPLLAQIAAGFTPPGLAIDAAEAAKYGRDAYRDFSSGELKSGLINTGIAGLSALGAIPLVGDVIKHLGKKPLKRGLLSLPPPKSQSFKVGQPVMEPSLTKTDLRETQNAFNSVQQFRNADEMFEASRRTNPYFQKDINKIAGDSGHRTVGNPGETSISRFGDTAEQEGKLIWGGRLNGEELVKIDDITGQPLGQIKHTKRINEKAAHKYGDNINQVTDPIRTRILVNSVQEAEDVGRKIGNQFETINSGPQVNSVGMRDVKLNIRYRNPQTGESMIAEVGITTRAHHKAAEKAHHDYNHVRSILREFGGFDEIPMSIKRHVDDAMDRMTKYFKAADTEIDSSWLDLENIKKYRYGGQVCVGNSGKSLPITPNSFSKSGLDSFPPFAHSASNIASAGSQESLPNGIYTNLAVLEPSITTDGTPSQLKYKLSDISNVPPSNIINNYKNKSTFINNIDQPLVGGRKEIM